MSLFKLEDIKHVEKPIPKSRIAHSVGNSSGIIGEGLNQLRATIPDLQHNMTYHFATLKGQWSLHEVIAHIVELTGPAKVYLTTWTITEAPARALFDLKQQGYIQSLHCLFDHRIKDGSPKPFQLITSIVDEMKLVKCHAKTVAILNEDWGVSISGSANLSRNPRIERGCIDTHRHIATFDRDWILDELQREE